LSTQADIKLDGRKVRDKVITHHKDHRIPKAWWKGFQKDIMRQNKSEM